MDRFLTKKFKKGTFCREDLIKRACDANVEKKDWQDTDDPYLEQLFLIFAYLIEEKAIESNIGFSALIYQHLIASEEKFLDWKPDKKSFYNDIGFHIILSEALLLYPKEMSRQKPDIIGYIRDYNNYCLNRLTKQAA